MEPSRRNHPSSDTIYQSTLIPGIKCISEKFGCSGNHFNVRIIFEAKKYTLWDTDEKWTGQRCTAEKTVRVQDPI
jgi:hypothetical protein